MTKTTTKPAASIEAADANTQFRVYHCSAELIEGMRAARDSEAAKNQDWIEMAISKHLPALQDLFTKELNAGMTQGRQAVRLPMNPMQLEHLKQASEATGGMIAASDLLLLCIAKASAEHLKEAAPVTTKKAAKPDLTTKAPGSRKAKGSEAKATKKGTRKRAK